MVALKSPSYTASPKAQSSKTAEPKNGFMSVKSTVRNAAERLSIPLSSRQAHRVTSAYLLILERREEQDAYNALFADPTGETAIKNVMAWFTQQGVGGVK